MKNENKKIGLSLSGGGYRAAAFHLGTLRKLEQLGIINKLNYISTVSGGSIVGAAYMLWKAENPNSEFENFEIGFSKKLQSSVIKNTVTSKKFLLSSFASIIFIGAIIYTYLISLAIISLLLLLIGIYLLLKYQFRLFPINKIIEEVYDSIFYNKKQLKDLPNNPLLIVNSTNLQTGRQFFFTKNGMGDSKYTDDYGSKKESPFNHSKFPIAKAVMASSCVPFAFTPVTIPDAYYYKKQDGNTMPILIDGGVYDNQGIHKLTHPQGNYECDIVIASDAGNLFPDIVTYKNTFALLVRTFDLFMNRIKNFQMMQHLYLNRKAHQKEIVYISLGWDTENSVKGFIDNLVKGNILQSTIEILKLPKEHMNPINVQELTEYLNTHIDFININKQAPDSSRRQNARSVGTNLTALSEFEIKDLSQFAEVLTEIQLKLYCPSLFVEEAK